MQRIAILRPEVVFDVGANVGSWSRDALKLFPNAFVYAFELSPNTHATLELNLRGSGVKTYNFGLSDVEEGLKFKDYGNNSGGNSIVLRASFHDDYLPFDYSVGQVRVGEDFCRQEGLGFIDLLKIDVEGAEHRVLRGFSKMLENRMVRIIQFEYGYNNGDAHFLMRDFHDYFGEFDYVIARVQKGGVQFRPWVYSDNDFKSGPNYVAVHKDDKEALEILSR